VVCFSGYANLRLDFGNFSFVEGTVMELKNKTRAGGWPWQEWARGRTFLKAHGAKVTVSDARPATLIAELSALLDEEFQWRQEAMVC